MKVVNRWHADGGQPVDRWRKDGDGVRHRVRQRQQAVQGAAERGSDDTKPKMCRQHTDSKGGGKAVAQEGGT